MRALDLLEKQNLAALPEVMRPPIAIDVVQLLALEKEWSRASGYLELVRETLDVVTWQALSAWVLKGDNHPQDAEGSVALLNSAVDLQLSVQTHPVPPAGPRQSPQQSRLGRAD